MERTRYPCPGCSRTTVTKVRQSSGVVHFREHPSFAYFSRLRECESCGESFRTAEVREFSLELLLEDRATARIHSKRQEEKLTAMKTVIQQLKIKAKEARRAGGKFYGEIEKLLKQMTEKL